MASSAEYAKYCAMIDFDVECTAKLGDPNARLL